MIRCLNWSQIMDILRLIIPIITFIVGSVVTSRNAEKQFEKNNLKELFIKFYLPFLAPSLQLFEQDGNTYSNYDDNRKSEVWRLISEYEFLLPTKLQKSIYNFRMVSINFSNEPEHIDSAWHGLTEMVISEYKNAAKILGYETSDRV